jgi:anaerobic C4-dicarboxylate transporter
MDDIDDTLRRIDEARRDLAGMINDTVQRGAEVSAALDKTLVSLSGGALVLSMTFIEKLAPAKLWLPILFTSWAAFTISIICVVISLRFIQTELSEHGDYLNRLTAEFEENLTSGKVGKVTTSAKQHRTVTWLNRIAVVAFLVGIILLGIFVGHNLLGAR